MKAVVVLVVVVDNPPKKALPNRSIDGSLWETDDDAAAAAAVVSASNVVAMKICPGFQPRFKNAE